MSTLLNEVDSRTRLAGANTMELLLFQLGQEEIYGINVFKVREIMKLPALTRMPEADSRIEGVANIRGQTVPVISLRRALGLGEESAAGNVIIAEYNQSLQGLHVSGVDRILRISWDQVKPPPSLAQREGGSAVTAVTLLKDGRMVLILDVEKVLSDICPRPEGEFQAAAPSAALAGKRVLFADDSAVARRQIIQTLDMIGLSYVQSKTGREALEQLQALAEKAAAEGKTVGDEIQLILTDIEMPEMDGFTLTRLVREDHRFDGIPILMHSSLTGACNAAKGAKVGATDYITKFDPKVLAEKIVRYCGAIQP